MDGEPAIRFADAEVLRVLLNATVGVYNDVRKVDKDGDGMLTEEELSSLTTLSNRNDNVYSIFKGNTVVETFNEFRYFTGLTELNNATFMECSSLREVSLPEGYTFLAHSMFVSSGIESLTVPEGYTTLGNQVFNNCQKLKVVRLPASITNMGDDVFRGVKDVTTIICHATVPPSFTGWGWSSRPAAIYVPDDAVEAYKTAATWSDFSERIYPISECTI